MEKRSSPPKKLKIKGQPHKLAYINDVEEGLLRARGGSGEMVHGIPAFYSDDDDAFAGAAMSDFESDYSGGNDGAEYAQTPNLDDLMAGAAARNRINAQNAATIAAAQNKPKVQQVLDDTNYGAATKAQLDALARSFVNSRMSNGQNLFAPSIYSSRKVGQDFSNLLKASTYKNALAGKGFNLGGTSLYSNYFDDPTLRSEISNMAVNQLNDRVAGYNSATSPFGKIAGAANAYGANNIIQALENGGRPVLDAQGNVKGAFNDSFLGEVYTGMPVEGVDGTGFGNQGGNDGAEIKEPNPLTGQCDEGYFFDEDLQACRMGSAAASDDTVAPVTAPATGAYYRPTGLETASAFTPAGFDYNAANSAFLDSYAYRPENYQDPMSLNGFKQIT